MSTLWFGGARHTEPRRADSKLSNKLQRGNSMESSFQSGHSSSRTRIYNSDVLSLANNVKPFREKRIFANGLLAEFPRPILEKLQPFLRTIHLAREDYVCQPDDQISYLYFPETAVFTEYQMLKDGRTIEIALIGTESAIGLASMLYSGCRASNWTQVCTSGSVVKVEAERFRSVAGQDGSVKALVCKHLSSYIHQISHRVICNAHHLVEQRLCTWLLMLQDRCGNDSIKVTQEQLARILGVYRPSITCIASVFAKEISSITPAER